MPKMPNARDIAIFQARTNGQTPAELQSFSVNLKQKTPLHAKKEGDSHHKVP